MRLLIAASGTGGHIFPALAVAEQLPDWQIDWLGVPERLEQTLIPDLYPLHSVPMAGIQGRLGLAKAAWGCLRSSVIIERLLRQRQIQGIFTTGGYIAAPTILAAKWCRLPVVLHESNAIPGKVTRLLAPWCDHFLTGMTTVSTSRGPSTLVGNPVRQMFRQHQPLDLPIPPEVPLILVMGGSQGARGLNTLVAAAAPQWLAAGAWLVHLTGAGEYERVQAIAPEHPHYLRFPFRQDVAALLQRARFAISRSGAMSLAELYATQTPAILVPYPYAAEDHQFHNAMAWPGVATVHREAELTAAQLADLGLAWLREPPQFEGDLTTEPSLAIATLLRNRLRSA